MSRECGICGFYPKWLRNRATPKTFIVVYGLLGTVQAMAFIYIVVTLTTLEKRFKIPSRTTGKSLIRNHDNIPKTCINYLTMLRLRHVNRVLKVTGVGAGNERYYIGEIE